MKSVPFRYLLFFGLSLVTVLSIQSIWHRVAFCDQKYDLLNPTKRCSDTLSQGEWNYENLREALAAKKEELKSAGTVTHISIYFQDLNHGPRFGIGEYDKFQPASLIKLPIFIFFLHIADFNPSILEKTLSYTAGDLHTEDSVTSPEQTIQPDTPYAIRELLRKMIVYSDNRSYNVLLREMNTLSEEKAYDTFLDLDVLKMMLASENSISISSYAKLYAVLYSTAYLSKEMSQYALSLLSESTFHQGIVAGVPKGTRVAHKFGYRVVDGESQLHDCGIIYHPKMAYTLCIMTSSVNQDKANEAIIEVSRTVHDAISALHFD